MLKYALASVNKGYIKCTLSVQNCTGMRKKLGL